MKDIIIITDCAPIIYLCILYYFHAEYFERCSKDIQISDDKMTITKIKNPDSWNRYFAKLWIDSISECIVLKFNHDFEESPLSPGYIELLLISKEFELDMDIIRFPFIQDQTLQVLKYVQMI